MLPADYVTLTDETVNYQPPRKKAEPVSLAEKQAAMRERQLEVERDCTDTEMEPEVEEEIAELALPTFSSVAALEDENEMPVEPEDDGETEEEETEVV